VGTVGVADISIIGNVNVDVIVRHAAELPPPGREWIVEDVSMRVGGAAAITALTATRLGARPLLVGCVGDDRFGEFVMDELESDGLDPTIHVLPGMTTGVSIAFEAPARDRSFLLSLGSLSAFEPSMVPDAALDARYVLLCGYFTLPRLRGDWARKLLDRARANGATTLLDSGWDPEGWREPTVNEVLTLLPHIDVFLPNRDEADALTGEPDPIDAARALAERSGGTVVVKLGPQGCVAIHSGSEVVRARARPVEVIDTVGAGDAFNAGLITALASGASLEDACTYAVRVGSTVVSRPSDDRYPTPEEVS